MRNYFKACRSFLTREKLTPRKQIIRNMDIAAGNIVIVLFLFTVLQIFKIYLTLKRVK